VQDMARVTTAKAVAGIVRNGFVFVFMECVLLELEFGLSWEWLS
jgi:hypothetical protein